jgi:hypothetical protein
VEVKRDKFLGHDFEPGGKVEFHRKDLRIALEAGREYGVSLPVTAVVCQLFEALMAGGSGRLGSLVAAHGYRGPGLPQDSVARRSNRNELRSLRLVSIYGSRARC